MTDGIQKGAGTAYKLQAPANLASLCPDFPALVAALAAGEFTVDLKLNPPGWDVLGTSLSKGNLLRDATAAIVGYDRSAVPDDMFYALANYSISGGKLVQITVVDEDGNPVSGAVISGAVLPDGGTPVTDADGKALVSAKSATSVTVTSPYIDLQSKQQTISPSASTIVGAATVILEFVPTNSVVEIKTSGTYKARKSRNALICCAGGGKNGQGGGSGAGGQSNAPGGSPGSGGQGGKIYNQSFSVLPNVDYEAIVASSGGNTSFDSISSTDGTPDTVALMDEAYRNKIGGAGGNGGAGGKTGEPGTSGTGTQTAGGGGGGGGAGGGSAHVSANLSGGSGGYSPYGATGQSGGSLSGMDTSGKYGGRGGNGGLAGGGGGGGGGGGAGGSPVDPGGYGARGSGGSGGAGGPGIILIKFLD